jgi:hypothetical protein
MQVAGSGLGRGGAIAAAHPRRRIIDGISPVLDEEAMGPAGLEPATYRL